MKSSLQIENRKHKAASTFRTIQMSKTTPRQGRTKIAAKTSPEPFSFASLLLAAVSAMIVCTLLLSGEMLVRFAAAHLPTVLWFALAAIVAVYRYFKPQNSLSLTPQAIAAIVFIGWFAVSSLLHIYSGTGVIRNEINSLFLWLGMGATFFVFCELLRNRKIFHVIVAVLISVAFAQSMLGLYQYAVVNPGNVHSYERNKDEILAAMGIAVGSPEQTLFENRLRTNDPLGTYPMTNTLAGVLTPILVLTIGIIIMYALRSMRNETRSNNKAATLFLVVIMICAAIIACLVLTKSRSGYAALIVGTACMIAGMFYDKTGKALKYALAGSFAAIALGVIAVFGVMGNNDLVDGAKKSLGYRFEYWYSTAEMVAENPVFGCGGGNFQQAYTKYKLPQASEEIADPHNFVMEIASNAGLPAMIAFFVFVAIFTRDDLFIKRGSIPDDKNHDATSVTHVFVGSLVGFGIFYACAFLSGFPMQSHVPVIMIPCFTVSFATLAIGIKPEMTPHWFAYPAIAAFFVNLSTAGGIGYPNVAVTFWILAAFCVPRQMHDSVRSASVARYLYTAVFFTVVAISCYNISYVPGRESAKWYDAAVNEPNLDKRISHLNDTVKADPYWVDGRLALSQMLLVKYRHLSTSAEKNEILQLAIAEQDRAEAVAPISASINLHLGNDLANLYAETDDSGLLPMMLKRYTKAVSLYPNHAKNRAPLAIALLESGDTAAAKAEAQKAIELDDLTPHVEQKLHPLLRAQIEHIAK